MRNNRLGLSHQFRIISFRLCRIELTFLRFVGIGLDTPETH